MSGLKATYKKHALEFKRPGGTSRGVLTSKDTWYVLLSSADQPGRIGIGECSLIRGLSIDDRPDFEEQLSRCCLALSQTGQVDPGLLAGFPAIRFGIETALLDLAGQKEKVIFPSDFTRGKASIPINGLVWMGDIDFMKQQVNEKLEKGFTCLKLKIGALDFNAELELLKAVRQEYSSAEVELRVDANGAFLPEEALEKLKRLSEFELHSIEQPIRQGLPEEMARLCEQSPLAIALDEELIGIEEFYDKEKLIKVLKPQYIIMKPSLVGGIKKAEEWISLAHQLGTGWWITSALESNVGLNAIAQWAFTLNSPMPQGLGTGQLFTNNIPSPLFIAGGRLHHDPGLNWGPVSA